MTLKSLYAFLNHYASQNIKNCNSELANIELAKIKSSFPLKGKQKKQLDIESSNNEPLSRIIGTAPFMSSDNDDLRKGISYLLYSIHCQMFNDYSNDQETLKYLSFYYSALGFHDKSAMELIEENKKTYQTIINDQRKYLKIARSFVKNIFVEIPNIDIDKLKSQAENMAKYDPYLLRRTIVQKTIKSTIEAVYEKNPALVIQGAATAISQIDLELNDNMVELLEKILAKKGIEKNDVDAIFESSDCISSLASNNGNCDKSDSSHNAIIN